MLRVIYFLTTFIY